MSEKIIDFVMEKTQWGRFDFFYQVYADPEMQTHSYIEGFDVGYNQATGHKVGGTIILDGVDAKFIKALTPYTIVCLMISKLSDHGDRLTENQKLFLHHLSEHMDEFEEAIDTLKEI